MGEKNLAMESVNSLCHNGDLSVKGETGSGNRETKSAKFWQGNL